MRKRTIKFTFDKILWLFLMLLPLIVFCIHAYTFGIEVYTITDVFEGGIGFDMTDGVIVEAVNTLIGSDGYVPILSNVSFIPYYVQWLCMVVLIQILFDVVMFIPKLAHKWLHTLTQDEE